MHERRKHPYLKGPPTGGLLAMPAKKAVLGSTERWSYSFPCDSFDLIYSLGVTTYQDPVELAA